MLITKHDAYKYLFELKDKGIDISKCIYEMGVTGRVGTESIKLLTEHYNLPVVNFYVLLNNKRNGSHYLIKEILQCTGKPVSTYIKIATSLITQATITLEKQFQNDSLGANKFIECVGLAKLSNALSEYFTNNNYEPLVETIQDIRTDIKTLLD